MKRFIANLPGGFELSEVCTPMLCRNNCIWGNASATATEQMPKHAQLVETAPSAVFPPITYYRWSGGAAGAETTNSDCAENEKSPVV